jgi:hypothetical protein
VGTDVSEQQTAWIFNSKWRRHFPRNIGTDIPNSNTVLTQKTTARRPIHVIKVLPGIKKINVETPCTIVAVTTLTESSSNFQQ